MREDPLDVLALVNEKGPCWDIVSDTNAKDPRGCPKIGRFEAGPNGVLHRIKEGVVIPSEELIINIDRDDDSGGALLIDEDGMVSMCASEAQLD